MAQAASAAPGQVDPRPVPPAGQASAITAPPEPPASSLPVYSKSVAFEVGEADLGRVHVRVAMTNDLVHTHFTSDRTDIGSQLMHGQDRLQSALQASGLDMGQFRVDIDRHSQGRSSQQAFQEPGRGWQQQEPGVPSKPGADAQDGTRAIAHGTLNLVA
jgi:hypothetical protein